MFTDDAGRFYKPFQVSSQHNACACMCVTCSAGSNAPFTHAHITASYGWHPTLASLPNAASCHATQSGPRSEREVAFYSSLFVPEADGQPRLHAAHPSPAGTEPEASHGAAGPRPEDVEGLKPFVPCFCQCSIA